MFSRRVALLKVSRTIAQGEFLQRMGIVPRVESLMKSISSSSSSPTETDKLEDDLLASYERLVDPQQMGSVYKALAITHNDIAEIPGF